WGGFGELALRSWFGAISGLGVRREHRELEMEAQAADTRPGRGDGCEAAGGGREGGRVMPSRTAVVEPCDQLAADRLDRLVEQRPGVASPLLEAVEQRDASGAV